MPSFGDSIFIFILALVLFGPERLPRLARELGKLMAEFRRASNEFKFQIEEELRVAEQKDQQKQMEALPSSSSAIDAAAPAIATSGEISILPPETGLPIHATYQAALDAELSAENGVTNPSAELSAILAPQEHSTPLPEEPTASPEYAAAAAEASATMTAAEPAPEKPAPNELAAKSTLPPHEHEEVNSTHG